MDGNPSVCSFINDGYDRKQAAPTPPPADRREAFAAKGYTSVVGRVALTAEETAAVLAALEALRSPAPEGPAATDPIAARRDLAETLAGLREEDRARRERAWEREDEAGAFRTSPKLAAQIAAAETALADFDAAHPEVLAAIDAAEAAAVESFLARD
jgi:hypothetical protein